MEKHVETPNIGKEDLRSCPLLASSNKNVISPHRSERIYIYKQVLASFLANIPSLIVGMALAWTGPALPVLLGQVERDPQPLRLSLEQASWVGGTLPLSSIAGALLAGPLTDHIGRKRALLCGAAPMLLGWALITGAGSRLWMLFGGRCLVGLSMGSVSGPVALYTEEMADVRVRGALGSMQFFMSCFGIMLIYGLGDTLSYFWFTAIALLPSVLFILTFWWMPESPAYLAVRGRRKEAHNALRWFKGPEVDCDLELELLLASKSPSTSGENPPSRSFFSLWSRRPWRSNALRSVAILMTLMFLQQMTGVSGITCYAVQIFQQADINISNYLASLISVGCGAFIGIFVSILTVDRLGRRLLLVVSFAAMGISLFGLVIYSHLKNIGSDVEQFKWVPVAMLIMYFISYGSGVGNIPWFLTAEMLPMYSKGWASTLVVFTNRIFIFITVKQYPLMLVHVGEVITYGSCCIVCLSSILFVIRCIPETKGKLKSDILLEIGGDDP